MIRPTMYSANPSPANVQGLSGVIVLNKPRGITSAKALYRVRRITRQKKSGHAGALDPAATGVLILCLGRATKLVESIMNLRKVYRALARLDVTSESFDEDRPLQPVEVARIPTEQDIEAVLASFVGTVQQVPPRISAIKIGGVPSYRIPPDVGAQPTARTVAIYSIGILNYDWPWVEFELYCGRGTYVRSLVRDLGQTLGTGGCLSRLERTAVGPFSVEAAWSLEDLEDASPNAYLIPLEAARNKVLSALTAT